MGAREVLLFLGGAAAGAGAAYVFRAVAGRPHPEVEEVVRRLKLSNEFYGFLSPRLLGTYTTRVPRRAGDEVVYVRRDSWIYGYFGTKPEQRISSDLEATVEIQRYDPSFRHIAVVEVSLHTDLPTTVYFSGEQLFTIDPGNLREEEGFEVREGLAWFTIDLDTWEIA